MRGKFVVVDGLDGVGKGVFISTFVEEAKKNGKRVLDVHLLWKNNNWHPNPDEIIGKYDVIITSEPTFVGIGKHIREEITAKNGRKYSPEAVTEAYALDRRLLYERLILPLLEAGIDVYQSRSFSTSLVYQSQSALNLGRNFTPNDILQIPGNAFCYKHGHLMDYLVIPTVNDVNELIRRLGSREKQDDCEFENLDFQEKIKPHYENEEFKQIFTSKGVNVIYLDAGVSVEHSMYLAREFYDKYLK